MRSLRLFRLTSQPEGTLALLHRAPLTALLTLALGLLGIASTVGAQPRAWPGAQSVEPLRITALVPACMALGFLILLLYFRATGGYRAETLSGERAT